MISSGDDNISQLEIREDVHSGVWYTNRSI